MQDIQLIAEHFYVQEIIVYDACINLNTILNKDNKQTSVSYVVFQPHKVIQKNKIFDTLPTT